MGPRSLFVLSLSIALREIRFNHLILLLQTIRLWLCFLSIWRGDLTPCSPAIRSHTLWRWRSVLPLIRIDRSYCRNNKNRLLWSLRAPPQKTLRFPADTYSTHAHMPPPSTRNSSGTYHKTSSSIMKELWVPSIKPNQLEKSLFYHH